MERTPRPGLADSHRQQMSPWERTFRALARVQPVSLTTSFVSLARLFPLAWTPGAHLEPRAG